MWKYIIYWTIAMPNPVDCHNNKSTITSLADYCYEVDYKSYSQSFFDREAAIRLYNDKYYQQTKGKDILWVMSRKVTEVKLDSIFIKK